MNIPTSGMFTCFRVFCLFIQGKNHFEKLYLFALQENLCTHFVLLINYKTKYKLLYLDFIFTQYEKGNSNN